MHDLTIHPRENDLVIATYGRALWTGDMTPLQELSAEVLDKAAHLFDVEPRARYGFSTQGMNYHLFGDKYLEVANEPEALMVNYYVKADATEAARIRVADLTGRVVRELTGPARAGLNRAQVNLTGGGGRGGPFTPAVGAAGGGAGAAAATGPAGQRGRGAGAAPAGPLAVGDYVVTVDVSGVTMSKPARVRERIR